MNNKHKDIISFFAAVLFAAFSGSATLFADVVDRVVAKVNDEVITLYELEQAEESLVRQMGEEVPAGRKAEVRRKMLDQLITKKLIDNQARSLGIAATDTDVDNALNDVLSRGGITEEGLHKSLASQGISYEEYRKDLRDQIEKARLISMEIQSKIDLSEERLKNYYYEHIDDYTGRAGVRIGLIFLRRGDYGTKGSLKARAEELQLRLDTGEPFEELAALFSEGPAAANGGDLGFIESGSLSPLIAEAIAPLSEGEVSAPVASAAGTHFIKLVERSDGEKRSFEKVRDQIHEILYNQEAEKRFNRWIQELKKKAFIEILL